MKHLRILLFVAIASPLLAFWSTLQDPVDWAKDVERACTSPRYGLRLAAARKVATGGAAAVPAIREFVQKKGRDAIPSALVDMIADDPGLDAVVIELLREWAGDRDFYWRASAMRGLALRAPKLPEPAKKQLHEFFVPYWDDRAWLMRTYAQFGGTLLDDPNAQQIPEPDPRARVKENVLMLEHGKGASLGMLLEALADERTFQGNPWGKRMGDEANKALKAWLGDQYPEITGGDTEGSVRAIVAAARQKSGKDLKVPAPMKDPATQFAGGIEILSCKWGDAFVQWTAAGEVHIGLEEPAVVRVPAEAWQRLDKARKALAVPTTMGTVVCDAMRLRWAGPDVHAKAAPLSLPAPVAEWLRQLACALDEGGNPDAANHLRVGLEQFAPR
ncbi:MAG TPA: hypothetical protein VFT55_01775 [Planctomycetota bacterium]|nr:hypothetical protein [Planctomycetota bacterium]